MENGEANEKEGVISAVLILLFLLIAGATATFIYRQIHASDPESTESVAAAGPSGEASLPAPAEATAPASRAEPGPKPLIPPKLLNFVELRRDIRKLYPPSEKAAGKEGRVLLALVVEADGSVSRADVKTSAGEDFDEAARKVGLAMRFTPASRGGDPVAVQIDEGVDFTLGR